MLSKEKPDHDWIRRHIPHQGDMCLLDHVEAWDERGIRCRAVSHRAMNNPLRAYDRLGGACGIEYAAQAVAVHGALLAPQHGTGVPAGYLVSARGVRLHVRRLDDVITDLMVDAGCITRSENNMLYQFSISSDGRPLLEGRISVVLNADLIKPKAGGLP